MHDFDNGPPLPTGRIRFPWTFTVIIYISNDQYNVESVLKSLVNNRENDLQNLCSYQLAQPDPLSFSRCVIDIVDIEQFRKT